MAFVAELLSSSSLLSYAPAWLCRLSTILVSRMIFNLREAGTEIYEGTHEWRSRLEQASALPPIVYAPRNRRVVGDESGIDTFDLP